MTAPSLATTDQRPRSLGARIRSFAPEFSLTLIALTSVNFIVEHLDRPASLTKTVGIWASVAALMCTAASIALQVQLKRKPSR